MAQGNRQVKGGPKKSKSQGALNPRQVKAGPKSQGALNPKTHVHWAWRRGFAWLLSLAALREAPGSFGRSTIRRALPFGFFTTTFFKCLRRLAARLSVAISASTCP